MKKESKSKKVFSTKKVIKKVSKNVKKNKSVIKDGVKIQ
jgi:hypothetical protein